MSASLLIGKSWFNDASSSSKKQETAKWRRVCERAKAFYRACPVAQRRYVRRLSR
jgi:hypothetical protein